MWEVFASINNYFVMFTILELSLIPTKPPPSFSQPDKWSPGFIDFVSRCLVKNPDSRATASELLQHEFIKNSKPPEILADMIREAQDTKGTNHILR